MTRRYRPTRPMSEPRQRRPGDHEAQSRQRDHAADGQALWSESKPDLVPARLDEATQKIAVDPMDALGSAVHRDGPAAMIALGKHKQLPGRCLSHDADVARLVLCDRRRSRHAILER